MSIAMKITENIKVLKIQNSRQNKINGTDDMMVEIPSSNI